MQDSYPAIVIHRISTPQRLKTNNGYVGVVETVLQVDCLALSWQDAATLCDSARVSNGGGSISLENFAGDMNGVQVLGVFVDDQRDLSQNFAPQHGDEYGAYSHMLQLRIWYQDNTP